MRVAFTGNMMSGKSEAVKLFTKLSSKNNKVSGLVKFAKPLYDCQNIFQEYGMGEKNRLFLQNLSNIVKKYFSENILNKIFIKNVETYIKDGCDVIFCDDVRTISEVETVKALGFYLIGINSNPDIRKRRNPGIFLGNNHLTETMVSHIINNYCNIVIENNGLLKSFTDRLEQVYYILDKK